MRAHVLKEDVVVNTIEVNSLDFMPGLIDGAIGGIGWRLVDGVLVEPLPGKPTAEEVNGPILAALNEIDRKTIRPLSEGETARVTELRAQAAQLRAKLVKV